MGKTKDINELKKEYIGQTFNQLTILDIYRNEKSLLICKCHCSCGNIKDIQMRYILSSHTTSCGCYNKSEEKRDKVKLFWENNPDKAKERGLKTSAYYKNNPEKTKERNKHVSESNKQYCRSNPDVIENRRQQHLNTIIQKRNIDFIKLYKDYIHPDDYKLLQHSNMKSIRSKCPVCNNYEYHLFGNIFSYNNHGLKSNRSLPLCHTCLNKLTTSSYEKEIEDFIKSFYNGEIVRNTRNIISPQELDIYIPDKKIAIEFNGDYWHSSELKDKNYHYNKYIQCKNKGILLVSIFESEWNKNKDIIKEYISDLFNNKENKLSFNDDYTLMNNNYPSVDFLNYKDNQFIEDSFIFNENKVYTCGYTKI